MRLGLHRAVKGQRAFSKSVSTKSNSDYCDPTHQYKVLNIRTVRLATPRCSHA